MSSFKQIHRQFLFRWPYVFLLFMLFALVGFIYEEVLFFVYGLPLEKRGFLFGPWLPIYGFGGILVSYLGCRYVPSKKWWTPFAIFLINGIFPTLLELMIGLGLKSLHLQLWDYSQRFGNLWGIIAPWPSIRFAIGGLFIYYLLLPLF